MRAIKVRKPVFVAGSVMQAYNWKGQATLQLKKKSM